MAASDFSLDVTSNQLNQPIHLQARQLLRHIILTEFVDGQKFYSGRKLSQKLKISEVTIARVLNDLVREGHLVSSPRRGFFVRKIPADRHLGLLCPPPGVKTTNRTLEELAEVCSERDIYIHHYYTQLAETPDQMIQRITHKPTEERIILTGFSTNVSLDLHLKLREQGYHTLIQGATPDHFVGKAVSIDYKAEVDLVLDHLTSLGHHRICFLFNEPVELLTSNLRRNLLLEAAQKRNLHGAQLVDCHTPNGADSHMAAYEKLREVVAMQPRPTAIIPISGVGALACLRFFVERRISIPGEISIVSLDPVPIAHLLPVPLTEISYSAKEYGRISVDLLWDDHSHARRVLIQPQLIVRSSTGPAPLT